MLDIRNVTMRFGGLIAVKNASLRVKPGSITGLIGPNGAGKTTLFAVASGFLTPSAGGILLQGRDVTALPAHARARLGMARTFQIVQPFAGLSTLENIVVGAFLHHRQRDAAVAAATEVAQRVGLGDFGSRYPHQMSGGMRKRAMLAQTLIRDPDIILMDEPFSALDIQTRQLMENEVLDLWMAQRKAVLFITHDLDEAIAMSDRVVVLSAGPATHPIGAFDVPIARPRNVAEVRNDAQFVELHKAIWDVLREEVLKGYAQQKRG